MSATHTPMTFNGKIINFQIILGGSPSINNFAHPPKSHRPARPTPQPSRSCSPAASDASMTAAAAQGCSTLRNHHTPAPSPILFPSPHLESGPSSASLLSSIGSPMEHLNGLRTHALIIQSSRQSNAAENPRISHFPSPAMYTCSHAGDLRLRSHERIDNNQSHQDGCIADMDASTQRVSFPTPCLPPYSFPVNPVNPRHAWSMSEPDMCDWLIDEREDEDYCDSSDA